MIAEKAFAWPRNTGARRGPTAKKQPRACETRGRHKHGARLAHRRCARAGKAFAWPRNTGARRGPQQRKQPRACEAGCKHTRCANCPPQVRVRARRGEEKDRVRDLLTAGARACGAFSSYLSPFPVWLLLPQKLFSFVAHAATGTPFSFRKENGGKEPREGGVAPPSNPHSSALRPIIPSPALLAGLAALRAANRRQIRETLEKPRSRAQLFKRFCAKGNACALSLISPFFWLLAGLSGPLGRKPPADKGNARKAKGAELQLFGRFCALGTRRGFSPPGKTGAMRGLAPGTNRVRARLGKDTNPVRVNCPPQVRVRARRGEEERQGGRVLPGAGCA